MRADMTDPYIVRPLQAGPLQAGPLPNGRVLDPAAVVSYVCGRCGCKAEGRKLDVPVAQRTWDLPEGWSWLPWGADGSIRPLCGSCDRDAVEG
jgi:hypothetical protein